MDQGAFPALGSKDGNRWAEWAEILYDVRQFDNVTQRLITDQGPKQRHAKLAAYADEALGLYFDRRTFHRRGEVLRRALAAQLLEMETHPVVPDASSETVDRPEVDFLLRSAILHGNKPIVWVHGDPGVGKTIAVRQVLPGNDVVWIDCATDTRSGSCEVMYSQIATILDANGVNTSAHDSVLRARFLDFLEGSRAPSFVVFENYDVEANVFPELLQASVSQCGVVIASRFPPPANRSDIAGVRIDDLTPSQSRELVCRYLQAADEDVDRLIERLFGRALLLDGACRLIRSTGMSIRDYLQQTQSAADLIRTVELEPNAKTLNLVAHYKFVVANIRQDERIFNLLAMLAELGDGIPLATVRLLWSEVWPDGFTLRRRQSRELPQDVIENGLTIGARSFAMVPHADVSAVLQAELSMSADKLAQLGLIEIRGETVKMHLLIRMVLRQLLGEDSLRASRRIVAALASRARQWQWRGTEAVPVELLELVHAAVPAIILSGKIADSPRFATDSHDDIVLSAALYAASARQSLLLRRSSQVMEIALLFDKRQLVRVEEWGHVVPSLPTSSESGTGTSPELASLMAELNTNYGSWRDPDKFSASQSYRRALAAVGIEIPSVSWLCCKKLSLGFSIERVVTGAELAKCRESLLRQRSLASCYSSDEIVPMSPGMISGELERRRDQQNLLIYGRYLASIGNFDAALEILTFNARVVTRVAASVESTWIAVTSLVVAVDLLLRLGRVEDGAVIFHELVSMRASRSCVPSAGQENGRFRVNDRNLDARILILQRELNMRSCFDDSLSSRVYKAARASYAERFADGFDEFRDWRTRMIRIGMQIAVDTANELSACSDLDLRYASTEQASRFSALSIALSENLGFDPVDIGQRFEEEVAAWRKLNDERHIRSLGFGQMAFYVFCEALQPGSVRDLFQNLATDGSDDARLIGQIVERGIWESWAKFAQAIDAEADALSLRGTHWYELARMRVLAACGAAMSGVVECEGIRQRGLDAAQRFGRTDWGSLIKSVRKNPEMLSLLFLL